MAQIARQAGMSAGHIYHYFDGKEAIVMAFVAIRVAHIDERLDDLGRQDDPLESICAHVGAIVDAQLTAARWNLSLEIYAEASRNDTVATALQAADADTRTRLAVLVSAARATRGLAADRGTVDGRIDAMQTLFNGLSLRLVQDPGVARAALIEACRIALRALLLT